MAPEAGVVVPARVSTLAGRLPLAAKELSDSWRGLIGWTVALVGVILLYLPFYPMVAGTDLAATYLETFPPELASLFGLDQMTNGAGYTQASYFGLAGFILLVIAAVGWGADAVAGAEERGALELTLAHGVTRTQVVAERALALLLRLAWLSLAGLLVILAIQGPSQLELVAGNVIAATVALLALSLLSGLVAMTVGAVTGRRSFAAAAGAATAVLAYLLDAVANATELSWLGRLSPYQWAFGASPITQGLDWSGLGLLLGAAALLLVVSVIAFGRRDLSG